jgi:adenylyltransferase/sulfurtransferase
MSTLSDREREIYRRQLVLPSWGEETQIRLKSSTVFVAGAGGLGSAAVLYLAAAGVGHLRVCDRDRVELSNLNRQVLHSERRLGARKALSARKAVAELNRHVKVTPLSYEITRESIGELVAGADLILDCLDNVPARLVINELSVRASIPLVHAGVRGLAGQLTFVYPPETACLACFLGDAPFAEPADAQIPPPILGATAGAMGCLQALEAIKHLTGIGSPAKNRMIFWDGESMEFEEVKIGRNPGCPVCGDR